MNREKFMKKYEIIKYRQSGELKIKVAVNIKDYDLMINALKEIKISSEDLDGMFKISTIVECVTIAEEIFEIIERKELK